MNGTKRIQLTKFFLSVEKKKKKSRKSVSIFTKSTAATFKPLMLLARLSVVVEVFISQFTARLGRLFFFLRSCSSGSKSNFFKYLNSKVIWGNPCCEKSLSPRHAALSRCKEVHRTRSSCPFPADDTSSPLTMQEQGKHAKEPECNTCF